jgi:hypothetical protein
MSPVSSARANCSTTSATGASGMPTRWDSSSLARARAQPERRRGLLRQALERRPEAPSQAARRTDCDTALVMFHHLAISFGAHLRHRHRTGLKHVKMDRSERARASHSER